MRNTVLCYLSVESETEKKKSKKVAMLRIPQQSCFWPVDFIVMK